MDSSQEAPPYARPPALHLMSQVRKLKVEGPSTLRFGSHHERNNQSDRNHSPLRAGTCRTCCALLRPAAEQGKERFPRPRTPNEPVRTLERDQRSGAPSLRELDEEIASELEAALSGMSEGQLLDAETASKQPATPPASATGGKQGKVLSGTRPGCVHRGPRRPQSRRAAHPAISRRASCSRHRGRHQHRRLRPGQRLADPDAPRRRRRGRLVHGRRGDDRRGPRHRNEQGRPGRRDQRPARLHADEPGRSVPRRSARAVRQSTAAVPGDGGQSRTSATWSSAAGPCWRRDEKRRATSCGKSWPRGRSAAAWSARCASSAPSSTWAASTV